MVGCDCSVLAAKIEMLAKVPLLHHCTLAELEEVASLLPFDGMWDSDGDVGSLPAPNLGRRHTALFQQVAERQGVEPNSTELNVVRQAAERSCPVELSHCAPTRRCGR